VNTFDEHLEELVQTANVAELNYKIWWIYKHERPEYVEVLNRYLGFFRVSLHAHFVSMLMALYKLGDPRQDSASVRTLLTEAAEDPSFDPEVLSSAKERFELLSLYGRKLDNLGTSFLRIEIGILTMIWYLQTLQSHTTNSGILSTSSSSF
jgi:AbiU2